MTLTTDPPETASREPRRRFTWTTLRADVNASLVVFLVAVPLSLGIALASGAPIMAGLIAAVVGGVVAGLLGGSPLQVSGPAAGLAVVVAELVARFGWGVTCAITVGAGLLQVLFGATRLGRFAQAVPPAVVHGMLAGIGITIALAQLHVVLGGSPQTGVLDNVLGLPAQLSAHVTGAAAIGVLTIAIVVAWPLLGLPRAVPAPLVAVVVATVLAGFFADVARVDLPGGLLDAIALPVLPQDDWAAVAGAVLTVALIASIESLLSAVAVDRMQPRVRTAVDRELIGQGAANTVSGLLGGLPVTGVIVRSSANVAAGARTRTSAVLHGVWVAVFAIALVGVIELIPLAALAGLLVVVGARLVRPQDVRTAREHGELAVYVVTLAGVLLVNLLAGVGLGLAVAGLLMVRRAVRTRVHLETPDDGPRRVAIGGTLSFLSVPLLARVLGQVPAGAPVHVDLVVDYLDHAAFDHLDAWVRRHRATGAWVRVTEPGDRPDHPASGRFATWSQWRGDGAPVTAPVLAGVAAFHRTDAERLRPRLQELAGGQQPSGLLLSCADSRVVPNVITGSGPGDLFTVQNVGNLVAGDDARAAVEYATGVLDVPLIAVCGHSGCGAMRALLSATAPTGALGRWLDPATRSLAALRGGHPVGRAALRAGRSEWDALSMVNVAVQLEELRATGVSTELMGLWFDIPNASVLVLTRDGFRPIGE
ncbi:SulP family inorganic anion transporter [Pseudonocardia sp. CA-107938]|uniref:SulP family inorganic anion transporter n=1 Tax=Pseudonocardia sp. CA-107938 TaxID=3240021 RepID=UPI003D8EFC4D